MYQADSGPLILWFRWFKLRNFAKRYGPFPRTLNSDHPRVAIVVQGFDLNQFIIRQARELTHQIV